MNIQLTFVYGKQAECFMCNDTGLTGWEKPMTGKDGRIVMVWVPQVCSCRIGDNFRGVVKVSAGE